MFPQSRVKFTLAFALAAKLFFFPLLSFGFKGRKGVVEELAFVYHFLTFCMYSEINRHRGVQ